MAERKVGRGNEIGIRPPLCRRRFSSRHALETYVPKSHPSRKGERDTWPKANFDILASGALKQLSNTQGLNSIYFATEENKAD